jgi:hypothetical protein
MSERPQILVDTYTFQAQLLEDKGDGSGKVVARGEFARADRATANRRLYPYTLWERELTRLGKQLTERKVFGELDHPMDGRTQLKRVSHLVTKLWIESGVVMGEAEILNTTEGKNLKAILEGGGKVGVSSRGFGTTKPNVKGEDVVQGDYRLMTFDFVADPANHSSYPTVRTEAVDGEEAPLMSENLAEVLEGINLNDLRESSPALYEMFMDDAEKEWDKKGAEIWAKKLMQAKEEAESELRPEFADRLMQSLQGMRAELSEEVRKDLLEDPQVAGARKVLDEVKSLLRPYVIPEDVESVVSEREEVIEGLRLALEQSEEQVAQLVEQNGQLAAIAKEAGYRYHVETLLQGNPHADTIRGVLGDLSQFESIDSMDAAITEICGSIQESLDGEKVHNDEVQALREENEQLRAAVTKSVEASGQLMLARYVSERLDNHPNPADVRQLIEQAQPESKEEVDALLERVHSLGVEPAGNIDEARQRVRNAVGASGTQEYLQENAERGTGANGHAGQTNWNGTGLNLDTVRTLSGYESGNN